MKEGLKKPTSKGSKRQRRYERMAAKSQLKPKLAQVSANRIHTANTALKEWDFTETVKSYDLQ